MSCEVVGSNPMRSTIIHHFVTIKSLTHKMNYYPGYQAYNRTINTSNNIVLTKICCEKIQAKDLALPTGRKQPRINKSILHMLEESKI
jgi:hypothetical protein